MEKREIDIGKARRHQQEMHELKRRKMAEEIADIVERLKGLNHLWKKYAVKKVYLYGSAVDGRLGKESDIDIAVEGAIDFLSLLHLFGEVDRHFDRQIDVRSLEDIPFKDKVIKRGVIIYEQ